MLGSVVAGRFKIERKAGAGGMGTVYRAHDLLDGTPVALKLLASDEIRDTERFAQEAGIIARLCHPAIVRYIAHGAVGGHHFLAMEWLEGTDLDGHIDRHPLSLQNSLLVLRRTAEALRHAHEQGIVHRDIKPANLFLPGGDIRALKLLDFGVARLTRVNRRLTQTGMLVGTPGYLAPEIISGAREVDARTDLFALGCVGFRCLSGRAPFEAEDPSALLAQILMQDAPSVRQFAQAVPEPVAALIASLLQRDPDRRLPDAGALLAKLQALEGLAEQSAEYRHRRNSASLTLTERRLVCVVLLAPPADPQVPDGVDQLAAAAAEMKARFSAILHPQGDGSLLISLPAVGKATDLAVHAARAALTARNLLPDRRAVVACGQAPVTEDPFGLESIVLDARGLLAEVPPGQIRLQEMVAALVEGRLELARDQQQVWLTGERDLFEAKRPLLGKTTEFVGRSRELASLLGMVTACVDEGTAQAALAVGPAGIGKSRLLQELLESARKQAPTLCVLFGAGDPLASGSAFGILARAVRRHAGVKDGEAIEESRRKLTACVATRVPAADCQRVAAFLGELAHVSFPDGHQEALRAARANPQLMGDLIRRAFEDWLKAESAVHPVLLVLEDLQWGDSGTVGLIDSALRNLRELPVMVLALARPEVRQVFPELWAGRSVQVLELGPLARKAAEKLVQKALAGISGDLLGQILTRADGNPFFLEELIRAASAGRTDSLPESVLGMVHARLDAEGEQAKRILRAASIFGDRFSRTGLTSLLGGEAELGELLEWLQRLIDRELVTRAAVPEGSEGEFAFLHGIVREAAYSTLTEPDRVLGHSLAGEHLEALGCPDAMVLAEHFRRGQQLARSVRWYNEAAEQALRASDLSGAIARADLGLSAAAGVSEQERLGIPAEVTGSLRLTLAEAYLWRGEFGPAEQRGTEAVAALSAGAPLWYRAVAQTAIAVAKQGKVEDLAGWVEKAMAMEATPAAGNAQVVCFAWACSYLLVASRQRQADALLARIHALVATLSDPDPQAVALVHQAEAARASLRGDPAACLAALQAAEVAFERSGDTRNVAAVRANIGFMYTELGVWERAEQVMREALGDAERMGLHELRAVVQHNLGRVLSFRGDLGEGERLERLAIDSFVRQGEPRLEGLARIYLADICLLARAPVEAEMQASVALRVLSTAPAARIQALAVLARALLAQGKEGALENARAAADELEVLGSIDEGEAEVRLTYAQCLAAAGQVHEAAAQIDGARRRLVDRALGIMDVDLRASFLGNIPAHARTLELEQAWNVPVAADAGEAAHGAP